MKNITHNLGFYAPSNIVPLIFRKIERFFLQKYLKNIVVEYMVQSVITDVETNAMQSSLRVGLVNAKLEAMKKEMVDKLFKDGVIEATRYRDEALYAEKLTMRIRAIKPSGYDGM